MHKKKAPYIIGIKSMRKPGCGAVKSLQELHTEITDKE